MRHMLCRRLTQATLLAVTYFANIKPILDRHCADCHHANGRNPNLSSFPFTSTATSDQNEIVERILFQTDPTTGRMPPGNRPKVTSDERQLIEAWQDQGLQP